MRILILLLSINFYLFAFDIKGNIEVEYKKYFEVKSSKSDESKSISGQIETKKEFANSYIFSKIEFLKDNDDKKREYILLNEIFYKYMGDDYDFIIGKNIKFWGALELHNLTDIFNAKNILNDVTDKDKKLGSFNISYMKILENEDELSFLIKPIEEKQKFVWAKNPLNNFPLPYDENFKKEKKRPTIYLKYDGSRSGLDFRFIFQNGYDSYRDLIMENNRLKQYLYLVNKFITYNTFVKDDTLYKLEFAYTDVLDYGKIDDYYEIGGGIEHTIYSLFDKKDVGVLAEYYKSDMDREIIYQNDIFVGVRISFNDKDSSEVITGVIKDFDNQENSYSFEYNTRFFENFKTKFRYLKNSDLSIINLNIGYYF